MRILMLLAAALALLGGCSCGSEPPPAAETPELAARAAAYRAAPQDDEIVGAYAAACRTAGRLDDARRLYGEALLLDPSDHEWLLRLRELDGDFAPVLAQLQAAAQAAPQDDTAQGAYGRVLLALGRAAEARPSLLRALQLNPASASWLDLYLESGGDTAALAQAVATPAAPAPSASAAADVPDTITALRASDDEYWGTLAKAKLAAGDRAGARAALDRALALDPEDEEWRQLHDRLAGTGPR